ncbi:hypothetical protein SDRG_11441 [Saprolegnia diclina VS20]|uniref:C2 domain-containing protein n=1 Tax=Saprolegnia diclina (strain VS20) TaxID=1156394 RepID=T0RFA9_SAPDV|nr:hypothetical protein SDRG_11441 [Saprolegnia diclina VS20]EQC30968.1 hypothetical protein SDRG_11441 [Saprolegnia diclina VS20]|eukprot:XP_008615706.1 hypothetical protein SDRG_11441 [Saprolegnia diclina VS20]
MMADKALRQLTRGLTKECIEEGILMAPEEASSMEDAPYFQRFSADFFEQLDMLVEMHFGSALWQDILQAQQPQKKKTSPWEPSEAWTLLGPSTTGLLGPTTVESMYASEPLEDNQVTHDLPSPAAETCTTQCSLPAFEMTETTDAMTPELRLDAMLRMVRLARTIQRAAQKFKQLLHRSERPMQLQIHRATGLRPADWNGFSDPYVIVTAFELRGVQTRYEVANYMMTKTEIQYKTLNPVWDFTVLLPHMTPETTLCLTVVDYDFGSSPDFLGQATISMDQLHDSTALELKLGPLVHTPLYADGSPMSFGDRDTPGQGTLGLTLAPVPCLVSGLLRVLPPAPLVRSSWFGNGPTFQEMYGLLRSDTNTLLLYSAKDRAACSPSFLVPLDSIARILDQENDDGQWELHSHEKHALPPWTFRAEYCDESGGSEEERQRTHARWVKALSRATHRPVLVERSPSQFRFKFMT